MSNVNAARATDLDDLLGQSVFDTRDLIERISRLEGSDNPDEIEELERAQAFAEELEGYCADFRYGEGVIRDSYFTEYAEELANDIGAVNTDSGWPNSYIDWDAAADDLKQDYSCIAFEGVDWWTR